MSDRRGIMAGVGRAFKTKPYRRDDRPGWWATLYDEHGKRRRIKVADDEEGYEAAVIKRQRVVERIRMIREGLVTRRQMDIADAAGDSMPDLVDEYAKHLTRQRRSDKHVAEVKRWLTRFREDERIRTLADLTAPRVSAYLADILDRGLSARTHNAGLARIRQFCRWCVRKHKLEADPTLSIEAVTERHDRREESRPFTLEQAEQLLTAEDVTAERRLFYRFGFRCGLRMSEIRDRPRGRGLRWSDLDLANGWLFLRASDTKSERDDELPMTPDLVEACIRFRPIDAKPDDFVFKAQPTRIGWLRDLVKAKLITHKPKTPFTLANLTGYDSSHGQFDRKSVRTSFITHRAWAGVDLVTLVKLARHTDPKLTLNIYTKALRMQGKVAGVIDLQAAATAGLESGVNWVPKNGARSGAG